MSGLGNLFGGPPPEPPKPYSRPASAQGLRTPLDQGVRTPTLSNAQRQQKLRSETNMHTKKGQMELPAGLVPPGPAHGNTISHAPGFGTLGGGRAPFGRTQVPSSRPYGHRPTSAQHRKLQAFGHQIPDSFTAISESQYRDLLSHSLRVDAHDHQASPSAGQMVRQKVIKHVEVPVIHEHTVPVERDVVNRTTRKQKIKGSRMVERHAHKEVTEMQVEVQEEEVEGTRMVWKLVPEPCTHVVKKPVLVPKTRQVPYTYYEPEEVEYEVEVPCEVVHRQQGHRVDQVLGAKTVAVEQEELYELRPHYVGTGPIRIKGEQAPHELLAHTRVGEEVYGQVLSDTLPSQAQHGLTHAKMQSHGRAHGLLTKSGAAGTGRPVSRPMSSMSRTSNLSAQGKEAQEMFARLTLSMTGDPKVRAALRQINARAQDLGAM